MQPDRTTFGLTRVLKEALNKWIPFMPFDKLRRAFDKLTTNGINILPFVLSPSAWLRTGLSKDL
jgi:hyperosmotically inducible protein